MADIKDFAALKALILEEWPGIDGAALDGTGGDDDQLVTVIAAHTEHTHDDARGVAPGLLLRHDHVGVKEGAPDGRQPPQQLNDHGALPASARGSARRPGR